MLEAVSAGDGEGEDVLTLPRQVPRRLEQPRVWTTTQHAVSNSCSYGQQHSMQSATAVAMDNNTACSQQQL